MQASTKVNSDSSLAFDGKALRGARRGWQRSPHLLVFTTQQSQETFLQVRVEEKTNEIPVAKEVLPGLHIGGRVCTADALHTHAELLQLMHGLGVGTILTVKSNQPTLYADLETYFTDKQAHYAQAQTIDRRRAASKCVLLRPVAR